MPGKTEVSFEQLTVKVTVIFGMVASFDVFMQNFYKITQGNQEKVPSFTTRLEGTLNQIQLKCPRKIGPQGGMPPQRLTIPWGEQAYKRLNKVST